jgi:ABC-type glycerol-3-phosphate transport system substrate-binding protein
MRISQASYSAPLWPSASSSSSITVTFTPLGVASEYSCSGWRPTGSSLSCVGPATGRLMAGEVEVLHWWTSGGEAKAARALKATLQAKGHTWKDFAVAGGGGDAAMTVLKSRVVSGNAPAAAQIKALRCRSGRAKGCWPIDDVAKAEKWDELCPRSSATS